MGLAAGAIEVAEVRASPLSGGICLKTLAVADEIRLRIDALGGLLDPNTRLEDVAAGKRAERGSLLRPNAKHLPVQSGSKGASVTTQVSLHGPDGNARQEK
jgi:hypothetical protein